MLHCRQRYRYREEDGSMKRARAQKILSLTCIVIAAAVAFAVTGYLDKAFAAGSKTIYVIDGQYEISVSKENRERSYKYNKKGLLTGEVEHFHKYSKPNMKFKYNKKNRLVRIDYKNGSWKLIEKYAYTKGGKLKSRTYKSTGSGSPFTIYDRYTCNKAGLPVKVIQTDKREVWTYNYSYNKKGRLVRKYQHYINYDATYNREISYLYTYKYDKKGNLKSSTTKDPSDPRAGGTVYYKNTYKKGRLVKIVTKSRSDVTGKWETSPPLIYTYKKIKVPKKMVPQIKKQQWAILNWNQNAALGSID